MAVDFYYFIWFAAECIFYTFHLSILLLLIVNRNDKFKGAFYNIFRIVLIADFLCFISSLIVQRISLITIFTEFYKTSTFLPYFMTLFTPFILVIQYFGRLLMAFNRFTSIWFPLNYQQLWKKQWYSVVTLLVAFLSISWRLHVPTRYSYSSNGNLLTLYGNPNIQPIVKGLSASIYLSCTFAAAIFNGLSFAKFYYNKRKSANYRMNEQHLLFMSIIIFIAQLGRTSYTVSQYLYPMDENVIAFFTVILPFLNDALALSGSVSFFLLRVIELPVVSTKMKGFFEWLFEDGWRGALMEVFEAMDKVGDEMLFQVMTDPQSFAK